MSNRGTKMTAIILKGELSSCRKFQRYLVLQSGDVLLALSFNLLQIYITRFYIRSLSQKWFRVIAEADDTCQFQL